MFATPPSNAKDDESAPTTALERFVALNDARLHRTREAMRPRQRDFLDLFPLLFHVNHSRLPGCDDKDCPAGIHGYQPGRAALYAANRIDKGFQYSRQLHMTMQILAIYAMGSPGSVAYSGESDLDVWICHDPDLDAERLAKLQKKANAIEAWAATLDLEVHFFLVHPDQFRNCKVETLSAESSGTAQWRLLLDEFYRTGVLIAGMYPLWWLVPPERELDYDACAKEVKADDPNLCRNFIDFGGLGRVPAEEFLGAAVWQLYKGIDSPYKSALKLLLIESYARNYPIQEILSARFKQAVYAGESDPDRLDSYLMVIDRVEEYLKGRDENERLGLARRCFYFKLGQRLSGSDTSVGRWRYDLLTRRVQEWGWSRADLFVMDSRDEWKVDRVSEERRILFEALSESYRFLSGFARQHAGSALISQRDLTILGRKLYAAFERKAGKVEMVRRGFDVDLSEPQLSVHEMEEAQQGWALYRGVVKYGETAGKKPLRRFRFITELVGWCYFNGVWGKATQLVVFARNSSASPAELKAMAETMQAIFPDRGDGHGSASDFSEPARMVQAALFINAGVNPTPRGEMADGRVSGGRSDALSYGGTAQNLVQTVDLIAVTSWQEVLIFHHVGATGLMDCLCQYLKWLPASEGRAPVVPAVASHTPGRGPTVPKRIEDLVRSLLDCFYPRRTPAARYVVQVERGYYVLYFEGDVPRYHALENQQALLRYLGMPQQEFSAVVFDRQAQTDPMLPLIYGCNKPGVVQFFFRSLNNGQADIYVLDERGSLFYRRTPFHDGEALLSQYANFFDAVLNRVNFLMQDGRPVSGAEGLEFYLVEAERDGKFKFHRKQPRFQSNRFISLQVIVERDGEGRIAFTFFCNGYEIPSGGSAAFEEVVRHVLTLRRGGQAYPIYITDLSISPVVLGDSADRFQTIHFLNYKHRIEERLSQAMAQAVGG